MPQNLGPPLIHLGAPCLRTTALSCPKKLKLSKSQFIHFFTADVTFTFFKKRLGEVDRNSAFA